MAETGKKTDRKKGKVFMQEPKVKRCKDCGLRIRCGDEIRHNEGLHHKRKAK